MKGATTTTQATQHFNISPRHARQLCAQYRDHGLPGIGPKSRNQTHPQTRQPHHADT
ncbi:helix-turn-helix domain-containing protein [Arcanobacterium phocae]|uniref:helix-turn-helix domain-containing protein n=1 Tax=Arcanobacterium phocae TaxID=131112 RepID=UPI00344FAC79